MQYADFLRKFFPGSELDVEDLLFLESFQIAYLPDRVPQKEFSTLLREYPFVHRFLISKYPPIKTSIDKILAQNAEINDPTLIQAHCDNALWEIADLVIYNKHPELYDEKVPFPWEISEIIAPESLQGQVVADVGAGSGMLSFLLAKYAKTVYAIEPITSFRQFIREKARTQKYNNIYTVDGFLNAIPFPEDSFDILFTSNAIGWSLEEELQEIERVVKPNGQAIHIMRMSEKETENPLHQRLVSSDWNYKWFRFESEGDQKLKYTKVMDHPFD